MIRPVASLLPPALDNDVDGDMDDPFLGFVGRGSPRDALWLGKAAPRYTSYPPATAFQNDFPTQAYRDALAALAPETPVSLYLHIPFCQSLCLYCGCHTMPTRQHERVSRYLDALHREMEHVAETAPRARRIARIHFGGGSPNMMSEKDVGLMFGALARRFDLSGCAEIAMELDPRLITRAQARALGLTGVNRVSLGIQDFNLEVQDAIGRIQTFEEVATACELLRFYGIDNLNFDLMYGLPLQSPSSVAETARLALKLKPSRIALFSYAHVPQAKPHQKALESFILPGPYACVAMEKAARNVLREAGYVEVGMDHFARPDDSLAKALTEKRVRRNFQGYTDDDSQNLLALGASGIGQMPDLFVQNVRDTEAYQERIATQAFATARGLALTGEDRLRAAVIENLMCYMDVNLETLCREHGYSLSTFSPEIESLAPFIEAGIVRREGYRISLAIENRMAVRVIAALFDAFVRPEGAPVSRAM